MTPIPRTHLWYDVYRYSGRFSLPECFCIRHMSHDQIDRIIKIRRSWTAPTMQPGSWAARWRPITLSDQQVQDLHDVCEFFITDQREKKAVFSGDYFTVYTNDLDVIRDISALSAMKNRASWLSEVVLSGIPNTIVLKNPRHSMRSYFRTLVPSTSTMINIKQFLLAQTDIQPSPSLREALVEERVRRFHDYYFFDHDNMGTVNMLSMISPGCIRKTMPIIADK